MELRGLGHEARHSKPYFILQLCFYSGQLARAQGSDPAQMHVILGTGEADHFRYADFAASYRAVRRHFLDVMRSNRPTSPYPVAILSLGGEFDAAFETARGARRSKVKG